MDSETDHRALTAPRSVEGSVERLAAYLTGGPTNGRDRARAIFRWMAHSIAYDTAASVTGSYGDLSAHGVLWRRTAVCEGYSNLFLALASAARLTAVKISGYAKGYGYKVGSRFDGGQNHSWNAVSIDDRWQLLDCTWGAGHIDPQSGFVREFEPHYFCTRPAEFIYDHLPEDPVWQLHTPVASKQDFEELVPLRPAFFKNKLELVSHRKAIIAARSAVEILLRTFRDTALVADLRPMGSRAPASSPAVTITGTTCSIQVLLPSSGDYLLRLFAKPRADPGPLVWALDYRIQAEADTTNPAVEPPRRTWRPKWWRRG